MTYIIGHNLNKLGRGLLGDATYQIPRLYIGLAVSDKKFFSHFPNISLYKTCDPGAEPFFAPGVLFEHNR